MYLALKHSHMLLVAISVFGFLLRSACLFTQNSMLQKKWVKILPHIIDTLLLASGIALMVLTQQYPTLFNWLSIKLLLIIGYIVFGIMMFRTNVKAQRALFFLLAVCSVSVIIYLAHFKTVLV